jgi:DNA-binding beta-propeller fold protein YncE
MSSQLILLWRLRAWVTIALGLLLLTLAAVPARSQTTSATVPAAPEPVAVAVNATTDKIYVLHEDTPTVSVIDGATNSVSTITDPGGIPRAIAVEPMSNKIYLANRNNIAVIDGATNTSTTLADSNTVDLGAVAVNPLTHKIYVTNPFSNHVTVVDEVSNSSSTVTDPNAVGPVAVAVNPVTNKIYVANWRSHNVTMIDGATNSTTTVTDSNAVQPVAIAVNPVTDKVYVANGSKPGSITVIDGATNSLITVTDPNARVPLAVAVNRVTNKIYVVNSGSSNYTAIDGATNAMTTVTDPNATASLDVAVNPVTNKAYVVHAMFPGTVTVIDGATNSTTTLIGLNAGHPLAARMVAEQDAPLSAWSDPVPVTCPVTKPPGQPFEPPPPYSTDYSEDNFWFGTDRLWTRLRTDAKWTQGEKTFWWRKDWLAYHWIPAESAAKLRVTARRLDAPAPALEIFGANSSYAGGPLLIGGIGFATTGCWQITARYEHDELSFVVWVAK